MKGDIVKIQNREEIIKRLREETDERVKPRLIFLNAMANHDISYEKASEICGLSLSTGYVWIRKWNAGRYEALKDKETRTGRPPRLNKNDMMKLREILDGRNYWTTKEVVKEIKTHFSVDLSDDQVIKILRNKFGMLFSKPYPMDFRRPANAEEILDNQLDLVFSLLKRKELRKRRLHLVLSMKPGHRILPTP